MMLFFEVKEKIGEGICYTSIVFFQELECYFQKSFCNFAVFLISTVIRNNLFTLGLS